MPLLLSEAITGSGQPQLDEFLEAVNDFLGQSGNDWNNKGAGGRWDADVAFAGNLAAVTGATLTQILQEIDGLNISGGGGGNFASTNLTRAAGAGPVVHEFNDNKLTIQTTNNIDLKATVANLVATGSIDCQTQVMSVRHPSPSFSGQVAIYESTDDKAVTLSVPASVFANHTISLPGETPNFNNGTECLKVTGLTGSKYATSWITESNFATVNLNRATGKGPLTHEFNNNNLTFRTTGTLLLTSPSLSLSNSTSTIGATIRLREGSAWGTDYVELKSPSALAATNSYTMPPGFPAGTTGYALSSDQSGVMSWAQFTPAARQLSAASGGGVSSVGLGNFTADRTIGLNFDNLVANTTIADEDLIPFEDDSISGSSNVRAITFGNLRNSLNILAEGVYRGGLTLGAPPNLPNENSGTHNIGVPLTVGDSWRITAAGTLSDGTDTKPVGAGDLLILENATPTTVAHYSVISGTSTDTNLFSTDLTNASGNRSHNAGGFGLAITNIDAFSLTAIEFGNSTAAGSALHINSSRDLTLAGYAAGAKDAPGNRSLAVDSNGKVVTAGIAPTTYDVLRIQLLADYTKDTAINLDGSTPNTSLMVGSSAIDLSGYANQVAFAADPRATFFVDGIKADKLVANGAHLSVSRINATSFALNRNLPQNTIIEFELIS